ncbi:MAG: DUF4298 domain-containing protein [Oscillospiraceae bacterium]|nr:DUF4298 domain-containing protein [Oscillospiraceae bacterium]
MEKQELSGERLRRVREMESLLDGTTRLSADLSQQLDALDAARAGMTALFDYYGSKDWFEDRECPLPEGVKAGVLSEDLVYDQIMELRESCFRMLELASDILKNVL